MCAGSAGLEVSDAQAQAFDDLSSYLGEDNDQSIAPEFVMCTLAIFVWTLSVVKEGGECTH